VVSNTGRKAPIGRVRMGNSAMPAGCREISRVARTWPVGVPVVTKGGASANGLGRVAGISSWGYGLTRTIPQERQSAITDRPSAAELYGHRKRNRLRTPLEDCGQAKRRACHHRKRIGLRHVLTSRRASISGAFLWWSRGCFRDSVIASAATGGRGRTRGTPDARKRLD
jgi:hypothetical protein